MTRTVTVSPAEALDVTEITATRPVWTGCCPLETSRDCLVQLRVHGETYACTAWLDSKAVCADRTAMILSTQKAAGAVRACGPRRRPRWSATRPTGASSLYRVITAA